MEENWSTNRVMTRINSLNKICSEAEWEMNGNGAVQFLCPCNCIEQSCVQV